MTAIQLFNDKNAIAHLPAKDQEIALALQSRMFKDLTDLEAFELIKNQITRSYILSRFNAPEAMEMQILVNEVMKEFKRSFGNIREQEVEIAFSRGIAGEYGEFMGLSYPTFINFAKKYLSEISRSKLLSISSEPNTPTKQERFNTAKDLALNTQIKFQDGKSIENEGATVFRFLEKLGVVEFSDDDINTFKKDAEKYIVEQKKAKRSASTDKFLRKELEKQLTDLDLLSSSVDRMSQVYALISYFQGMEIEFDNPNEHLENEINEKGKKYL